MNPGGGAGAGTPLDVVRRQLVLSREELWVLYIGLGGELSIDDFVGYLTGTGAISRLEYNVLVQALNEVFLDSGRGQSVAYRDR